MATENSYIVDKLKEYFEMTLDNGLVYDGSFDRIDFYNLFCKAAASDQLKKLLSNNYCMFKCYYKDVESIMIVFAIPLNPDDESASRHVVERVMEIVANLELAFVYLDFMDYIESVEDKFIYLLAIKKLKEE